MATVQPPWQTQSRGHSFSRFPFRNRVFLPPWTRVRLRPRSWGGTPTSTAKDLEDIQKGRYGRRQLPSEEKAGSLAPTMVMRNQSRGNLRSQLCEDLRSIVERYYAHICNIYCAIARQVECWIVCKRILGGSVVVGDHSEVHHIHYAAMSHVGVSR